MSNERKYAIYYAHPMSWYGTDEEALDVQTLSTYGHVHNPNSKYFEDQVKYARDTRRPVMQIFADFIASPATDVVAFRRMRNGRISAGVAREIFEALIWGKEVWEIVDKMSGRVVYKGLNDWDDYEFVKDVMTVEETKAALGRGEM